MNNVEFTTFSIDYKQTGQNLKYRIRAAGFTMQHFADCIGLTSVDPLKKWCAGKNGMTVLHLIAIATVLDLDPREIVVLTTDG